ncbi:bacteriocin ABC transporter ATP-binding protein [Enterococcus sp. JM4C]|uniref:putative bacteriocin export ABC transporter n=1 Tax=Candidatus Enterococcus huntleyi TaxID=1857217 RepID=UPI00137AC255|nr:putative bacteriocin export ABC transporter [Enterococcus sp. JM4C]KAF1299419.1 bacteriocin ABC transporter ATP-binding protein [Enterococcus sp. JM4C]
MLTIENLSKKFGENDLFKGFNLEIADGELVAITGKSGSGKTTLLNMIGLIDTVYTGEISNDGQAYQTLSARKQSEFIRYHINYLFQNYALIDDETVENNLLLALYYTKYTKAEKEQAIIESLAKVGLSEQKQNKVFTLSGGEQQRVALARVLLKPGNLILADEPTGNLDDENRDIVLNNLHEQNAAGKTVIIVTHDHDVANACHRIITVGE